MTVDPKCADLAEAFAQDHPWTDHRRIDALAEEIQRTIEDWIANEETNQEYPDPRDAEDWKRHAE